MKKKYAYPGRVRSGRLPQPAAIFKRGPWLAAIFLFIAGFGILRPGYFSPEIWAESKQETTLPDANWGRDPFVSPEAEDAAGREGSEQEDLQLTGILLRGIRRVAIINRVLVREGDRIYDAQVVRIEPDRVVVNKEGNELTLRMGAA